MEDEEPDEHQDTTIETLLEHVIGHDAVEPLDPSIAQSFVPQIDRDGSTGWTFVQFRIVPMPLPMASCSIALCRISFGQGRNINAATLTPSGRIKTARRRLKRFAKNLNHRFSCNAHDISALRAFRLYLMPQVKGETL